MHILEKYPNGRINQIRLIMNAELKLSYILIINNYISFKPFKHS